MYKTSILEGTGARKQSSFQVSNRSFNKALAWQRILQTIGKLPVAFCLVGFSLCCFSKYLSLLPINQNLTLTILDK